MDLASRSIVTARIFREEKNEEKMSIFLVVNIYYQFKIGRMRMRYRDICEFDTFKMF